MKLVFIMFISTLFVFLHESANAKDKSRVVCAIIIERGGSDLQHPPRTVIGLTAFSPENLSGEVETVYLGTKYRLVIGPKPSATLFKVQGKSFLEIERVELARIIAEAKNESAGGFGILSHKIPVNRGENLRVSCATPEIPD